MVSAKLSNSDIPETRKGRWSIFTKIVKDAAFKKTVKITGKEAICKLDEYTPKRRTNQNNPQMIYADFKTTIMTEAQKREHTMTPKMARESHLLQEKLNKLHNGPQDEGTHIQAHEITKNITQLECQHHQNAQKNGKVKNQLEGETMSKYWICSNNEIKP